MGDFMPPGRGCVGTEYDRQRRRFERYRQLHAIRRQQYDTYATNAYSQQLHETQMLHKKWLESVASKKPPSAAKSAGKLQQRTDSAQLAALPTGSQPSNVTITTKKFKRTANGQFKSASSDSPPPSSSVPPVAGRGVPEATYAAGFDHNCSPTTGVSGPNMMHQSAHPTGVNGNSNAMHNSVSVNINVDTNLHRSQSAIKLTFSSTINGHTTHQQQQSVPSGHQTNGPPSATPPTMGSGSCSSSTPGDGVAGGSSTRQAPMGMPTGQFSSSDPLGNIEDFDELSDLLDKFEQDNGPDGLPNDILKILDEGVGGFDITDFTVDGLSNTTGLACSRETMSVNNAAPRYGPGSSVGFPSGLGSMPGGNAPAFGPLGGPTKIQESCTGLVPAPTASTLLGDTGPAAETLKQMAAQHQNQANRQYSSANVYADGFNSVPFPAGAPRRLPRYPVQQYPSGYAMPSSMYQCDGRFGYGGMDSTMGNGMGRSMPMDHARYAVPSGGMASQTPTSLQRLENQVQSHFAPGNSSANSVPSVDIPHFRMEQSQRIDVRGSQMAVAQQQSFSMSIDGGISSGSNLPGAHTVYHRYPQPAGNRQAYPGGVATTPMRMMSAGYQNMAQCVTPGTMQQCSGSGSGGTVGRQQQMSSSDMGAAATRVSVPAGNGSGAAQGRQVSGHGSPAVPLLPAKVESVSTGYVAAEQGISIGHDVKSSSMLESSMSAVPSSLTNTASGVKGMVQRSPYMPGNAGENNYSQIGKWMPHNIAGANHALPASDMRNSFAGGYAMPDSMQSGNVGQFNSMDFQNSPRWSVSMSQSQSMFVNGGSMPTALGSGVYHPGAMMDANYSRSQSQHTGYGQGVGFFNSGPTGMMVPVGPGDVMSRQSAEFMHRGLPPGGNGPQNVDYDVFHSNRGPSMVPEFACIEDVFMGK